MNEQQTKWNDWAHSLSPDTVVCVAVKIVKPRHADTVDAELAVHRQLANSGHSHPQVARLIDSFVSHGHSCLVSEMFGEELGAFADEWELDRADAKKTSRDILRGLKSLHSQGIVHTDLKPANVLYSPNDHGAKLIDFSTATTRFRKGRHFGTREYRAPEVLLGNDWDFGVDVWSAACTIYEIVTGDLLFNAHRKAREVRGWLWKKAQIQYDAYRQARAEGRDGSSRSSEDDEEAIVAEPSPSTPFSRRTILNGRYILVSELGSGHFSTVWKAVQIPDDLTVVDEEEEAVSTPTTTSTAEDEPIDQGSSGTSGSSSSPDCPYSWARLYDRCMTFSHFLSIQECLGHYPMKLAKQGDYFRAFYTRRKRLKFNRRLHHRTLTERLIEDHGFLKDEAEEFASFLTPMLAYDPKQRASVEACLRHPWISDAS